MRAFEAHPEKLVHVRVVTRAVEFVDEQADRLLAPVEQPRHGLVFGQAAGTTVDHEENRVGLVQRRARLGLHREVEALIGSGVQASGIDQQDAPVFDLDFFRDAIARDADGALASALTDPSVGLPKHDARGWLYDYPLAERSSAVSAAASSCSQ